MDEHEERVHHHVIERLLFTEWILVKHSVFAFPHFWLWHALFDGTWLCRCWHSNEMKKY